MEPRLVGIGTAVPEHTLDQAQSMDLASRLGAWREEDAAKLAGIYRRSTIAKRGSVLLGREPGGNVGQEFFGEQSPTTARRFKRFEAEAPGLAARAARAALADGAVGAHEVTHLIVVSCTGASAPGVDAALVGLLGLRGSVERTFVGFMGCAGAISGLAIARSIAADGLSVVLVVSVELCSLHLQYSSEPQQVVANALFADGAAAAVVSARGSGPRIAGRLCQLIPDSSDSMTWRVGDQGLRMTLSPRVPEIIARSLRGPLEAWLGERGLGIADVAGWVLHPGGPRVIEAVESTLEVRRGSFEHSRGVLSEHGNMSSATVLFVYERVRAGAGSGGGGLPCVWLGFSPGLTVEALLLV
jgi:predicted naringenin-chalcone synthase